jgi:hypothetical protein
MKLVLSFHISVCDEEINGQKRISPLHSLWSLWSLWCMITDLFSNLFISLIVHFLKEVLFSIWWTHFPVIMSVEYVSPHEVAALVRGESKQSFVIVDVRDTDHNGGHIRGSFNVPIFQYGPIQYFWGVAVGHAD